MTDQSEQRDELQDKLDLEVLFMPFILGAFADERALFNQTVRQTRLAPNESDIIDVWKPVILRQMLSTSDKFKFIVEDDTANDIIDRAIANSMDDMSSRQSAAISRTSKRNMDNSLAKANMAFVEDGINDATNAALATVATRLLTPTQMGRDATIAMTTTQTSAETSKGISARVVGSRVKTWITAGDERVRSTHVIADGQEVSANQPFTVGSSQLMFPGDTSLGAGLEEIINCRCSAIYSG